MIEIGLGQKRTDIDIHLPPPAITYLIRGFVGWPDGSLARGVDIYLEAVDHPGWCVNGCSFKTDDQGRFELQGFDGYTYRVVSTAEKSMASGKEKENVYGLSDPFQLAGVIENLKVVINLPSRPWDTKESKSKDP